jgi:hypothetical protein
MIARVEIQLFQETGESEPSPELPTTLPGSQPPENSLTEAPTDPDGPNAGVVTGVVVGIVGLSLSIAGAATAAGICWYELKRRRREDGSRSQVASPPPPILQQQENTTASTIVPLPPSRPNVPPGSKIIYPNLTPTTAEDTRSENGKKEEPACFRSSEQATKEKNTRYGNGSPRRPQFPSRSQSKRDEASLPQSDVTLDSTDGPSSHRPDCFSGTTGPAELDIELCETQYHYSLPQSPEA